ncbi:hypothetical protein Tco_0562293, partial [Tanacetum coccineum]
GSTRDNHPSIRYSANKKVYSLMGERECYAEAMGKMNTKKEWFDCHAGVYNEEWMSILLDRGTRQNGVNVSSQRKLSYGALDKEIYIEQPEGFQLRGRKIRGEARLPKGLFLIIVYSFPRFGEDAFSSYAICDDMWITWGPPKQILGIRIFRDRGAKKLHISQEQYIEKVLRRFNMDKAKVVSSPLTPNFKLTDKDCPSSKKNIEKMDRVPYALAVW